MEYPVARRSDTVQHFPSLKHGLVQVPDPYDWMDDLTSQETEVFLEAQNALLSQYLTDPVLEEPRTKLVKLLQSIQTNTFINDIPLSAGRFYILRVGGRGHSHCMTFKIPKARIREFLEAPANVDGDSLLEILHDEAVENQVVIATGVSRSGKYWAYNASVAGSDWGVIRVKDIETGQMLPDEIHDNKFNTKPARISWLDDRGFFYQYWKPDGEGRSPPQLRFHVLGEAQAKDEVVYEDPSCPGRCFWATVSHDGALVFLHVYAAGWASQVYAARISRADVVTSKLNLEFKSTISNDFSSQWEYIGLATHGQQRLYMFWTDQENGQVVGFDVDDGSLKIVIPSVDTQCLKLARVINDDYLLAVRSVDVRDQLHVFSTADGQRLKTLDAPVFTVFDVSSDPASEDIFFLELSFARPPSLWHMDISFMPIRPLEFFPQAVEPGKISTHQVFYSSTDGTRVPMFLTAEDDYPVSATTPVLLYVYGAFGISVIPHFRPEFLTFISAFHGLVAVANIRGGGEYGRQWYLAGCKENRQRVFDDIKSAAQYLKSTFGSRTVILMGESMGGLNCAATMIQEPALASAVILNAGALDALRLRDSMKDDRGKFDIGDPQDPADFDIIRQWSPLENIRDALYPPVLLTAGAKDDVTTNANSGKFTAALQHVARRLGKNQPIHLRVIPNLAHGGNISANEMASIVLERWIWLQKTLGLKI